MPTETGAPATASSEPPDGGYGWVVVACVFAITFLSFGTVYSIGIMFDDLMDEFACSKAEVSAMASINLSLQCFLGPVVSLVHNRFGDRLIVIIGCLLISVSFICSAFATNILYLYAVFGVLGGIGMAMAYLPVSIVISFYFKKRRAMATALGCIGAYAGCFVHPYLIRFLISFYGLRGALFLLGAVVLNSLPPALFLRPPDAKEKQQQQDIELTVDVGIVDGNDAVQESSSKCARFKASIEQLLTTFKDPKLSSFIFANFLINAAYYSPSLFIVDWGKELGIEVEKTTFLLSLVGIGNILGRFSISFIGDLLAKRKILVFILANAVAGSITAITPLFASFYFLAFFVCQFAFLIGGSQALRTPVIADLVPLNKLGYAFGLLIAVEGVATLIGPPLLALLPSNALTFTVTGLILFSSAALIVVILLVTRLCRR